MLAVSCTQKEKEINEINAPSGEENGYTWVNLGLSVKWATMNVGATTPEGYGDYYAWGEVTTKSNYYWSTYKHCMATDRTMTKYCKSIDYGTVDNKTTLDLEDDAAHVNWGGNWRMPTDAEWKELREQCTWVSTTLNGIECYRVISNYTNNYIFLPAAGYRGGTSLHYVGLSGYYWSSSLNEYSSHGAYDVCFYLNGVDKSYDYRSNGQSIRPVCP